MTTEIIASTMSNTSESFSIIRIHHPKNARNVNRNCHNKSFHKKSKRMPPTYVPAPLHLCLPQTTTHTTTTNNSNNTIHVRHLHQSHNSHHKLFHQFYQLHHHYRKSTTHTRKSTTGSSNSTAATTTKCIKPPTTYMYSRIP